MARKQRRKTSKASLKLGAPDDAVRVQRLIPEGAKSRGRVEDRPQLVRRRHRAGVLDQVLMALVKPKHHLVEST